MLELRHLSRAWELAQPDFVGMSCLSSISFSTSNAESYRASLSCLHPSDT
jgi:hypothetical protein